MTDIQNQSNHVALFKGKKIRKTIFNKEWHFSVVDVVEALTDSPAPRQYWGVLKGRESQLLTFCLQLKLESADGKKYETDCANTEGIFRIIQSIPSPKAEPFKRWLARVGYERVQEIENPELATKRTRMLYKLKGYPEDWIEKRMRGIAIREELTDEWQKRGAQNERDYEILTAEIHRTKDTKGLPRLKDDARVGGQIAGTARKQIERKIGRSVVSNKNFLNYENKKRLSLNS